MGSPVPVVPRNKGQKVSDLVVGVVIASGLLWLIWVLTDPLWRRVCFGLLAYEAYTIVNRSTGDTISESVWRLSARPLVPYLGGLAVGWAIGINVFDPLSIAAGFLAGHFFWQAHR